jgi:3-methylcrotonyl-CoA carboxylase beta subunit
MSVLEPKVNPRSEEFKVNAAAMRALVDDLNAKLAHDAEGGGAEARAKHVARGKLLPRERVERLLDPDTPFLEIAPLAALGLYPRSDGQGGMPRPRRHGRRHRPRQPGSSA